MKWSIVGEDSKYIPELGAYLATIPIPKTSHTGCFLSRGKLPRTRRFHNIIFGILGILGVDGDGVLCYPRSGWEGGLECSAKTDNGSQIYLQSWDFGG